MVTRVKTTANSLSVGTGSSRVILGANSGSLTVTDPSSNVTQIVPGLALTTDTSDYLEVANASVYLEVANASVYLEVANAAALIANNTTKYLEVANAGGGSISSLSDVANTTFSNGDILIYDGTNFKGSVGNTTQGVAIGGLQISPDSGRRSFVVHKRGSEHPTIGASEHPYQSVFIQPNVTKPSSNAAYSVVIGDDTGNDVGYGQVLIGSGAGKYVKYNSFAAGYNVFIGDSAGEGTGTPTCQHNIAIGSVAMTGISSGDRNIAIGRRAMRASSSGGLTGNDNIAIGEYAGPKYATSSSRSIFIGRSTGKYHKGSNVSDNIGIGYKALHGGYFGPPQYGFPDPFNTSRQNIAIGHKAGYHTVGPKNIVIGYKAGYTSSSVKLTTGNNNIIIGEGGGITTGSNNVVIGASATASATGAVNEITLGGSHINTIRAQVTSITALSDERDKTNIVDIPVGLDFVSQMRPVKFDWNRRDGTKQGEGQVGFIAQELQSLERDFDVEDYTRLVYNSNPEKLEATPLNAFPILVKAIQELSEKNDQLQAQIDELQAQIDELKDNQ